MAGPCLADTAGPGQGDERHIAPAQERLDKPNLSFSPHKRRSRYRQGTRFKGALVRHGEETGQPFPR
jgi:hypothetical protein